MNEMNGIDDCVPLSHTMKYGRQTESLLSQNEAVSMYIKLSDWLMWNTNARIWIRLHIFWADEKIHWNTFKASARHRRHYDTHIQILNVIME